MWILVLQAATRDKRIVVDQRFDHSFVCVTFFTLVGDHTLTFKARRFLRVETVIVNRERNTRINAALGQHTA